MNLKQLTYFIEVAEQKSFTKAAKKLFVCQSALSKMMKVMEADLDVQLIDRSVRKFQLTAEGELLYENGKEVLNNTNRELGRLIDSVHKHKGKLSIGIPPVIGTAYFTNIVSEFRKLYPEIELSIVEKGANTVKEKIENGSLDIGVIILPCTNIDLDVSVIFSSENVAVVPKSHPLARRKHIELQELKNEKFILLNDSYMLHGQILEHCELAGFTPNIVCESSQWDFVAEMVALQQGVTILPLPILKKYKSKEIVTLHLKNPKFPWDIAMILKKERYISNPIKTFLAFMEEKKN